ncbi:MAG: pentapeptide repeat-containing protein [Verrucomicrobia bacterium]|nr:pentapeptide repeat-containing protein [Verrucomicrobiota bacterium]
MVNEEQLRILRQGVAAWNRWRGKQPAIHPDLCGANLRFADLREADLSRAGLRGANLSDADLRGANLSGATLRGTDLFRADLFRANLSDADLHGANLRQADLTETNLRGANLSHADLVRAQLISTDLAGAMLTGSSVYGVSVWGIKVNELTKQQNFIITDHDEPVITVDNIKVAQFIHLLLNNQEIREVIDTITSKAVLILGRFSEERKPVLDTLREALRKHDYLPILFDFPPLPNQATLGTIKTLASMARFVIADLTDARSVLQELQAVVPAFPAVAVRLMIRKSEHEYGMLDEIRLHRSVVEDTYEYEDTDKVIASIRENIIAPAEAKVEELRRLIRPVAR